MRRAWAIIAHPKQSLLSITGGAPIYPLIVLFGLNAVDELDRTAFGILVPEIRDEFGLDLQGVLTLIAFVSLCALALQVPIADARRPLQPRAHRLDRRRGLGRLQPRHRLRHRHRVPGHRCERAPASAGPWSTRPTTPSSPTTTSPPSGPGSSRPTGRPTPSGPSSDRSPPGCSPPPTAGGRRSSSSRCRPWSSSCWPGASSEPVRGAHERRAMGASEEAIATEEEAPSFAEGWRMVWKIETLRRIWYSLPFLAASLIGFVSLASLLYDEVFGLDEKARGFVAAVRRADPARRPHRRRQGRHPAARRGPRARCSGSSPERRCWCRPASSCSRLAPNIWVAIAANMVDHRRPRHHRPRHPRLPVAGHPAPGPIDRLLGRRRSG